MRRFYCAAPSCPYVAESGSQYCGEHNGRKLAWYAVERDGRRVNVRAESQAAAELVVSHDS